MASPRGAGDAAAPPLAGTQARSAPVAAASVLGAVGRGSGPSRRCAGGAGCCPRRCGWWGALVLVGAEGVEVVLQALLALLPQVGVGEVGEDRRPGGVGFAFGVHQG